MPRSRSRKLARRKDLLVLMVGAAGELLAVESAGGTVVVEKETFVIAD